MRLSQYFLPVLKETPKEAQIASHRLMLRAGMIQQSSAGIYSWLPLGKRVLDKIEKYCARGAKPGGCIGNFDANHPASGNLAGIRAL
ncbi:MAG: hypothetical protein CM15mP46_1750 [Alphaproteobacteria bacterium]|nr:MAG: hypothetical protein CM15mP46_1750 [Alphaproteobacteria bacterium]